jgi:tRNA (adenine-N(1)-)-methyltransferase non-catalytic subunit
MCPSEVLIGLPWGSILEIVGTTLSVCKDAEEVTGSLEFLSNDGEKNEDEESKEENTKGNSDGVQKLTAEEIVDMKKKGVSAEELVKKLTENSATFEKKPEYTKEKYVKKKKNK